jgi:hypothetical protein
MYTMYGIVVMKMLLCLDMAIHREGLRVAERNVRRTKNAPAN